MDLCLQSSVLMKTKNSFKIILLALTALALTSCAPEPQQPGVISEAVTFTGINKDEITEQLSKTSTGNQAINDLNSYIVSGYTLTIQATSAYVLAADNGYDGGKYEMDAAGKKIKILINASLPASEQAHIIVHEISHIKDDLLIEKFLTKYPDVKSMSNYFVTSYKYKNLNTFDPKIVKYVLTTLFCTEARAYAQNQKLANEGFESDFIVTGSEVPKFIDQTYIRQFKTSYASQAVQLHAWCLNQPSMEEIQKKLVW